MILSLYSGLSGDLSQDIVLYLGQLSLVLIENKDKKEIPDPSVNKNESKCKSYASLLSEHFSKISVKVIKFCIVEFFW